MADFTFTNALKFGVVEMAAMDLRAMLVLETVPAIGEDADVILDAFDVGLYEFDGAGYARQTLSGLVATKDASNNRYRLDCDPIEFGNVSAGAAAIKGMMIFQFVTDDEDHVPLFWKDSGGFPYDANGGPVTWMPNELGLVYRRNGS